MKKKSMNAFLHSRKVKKWILTMKLTIVLLLAGLMQVSATVYSQATKFSFRVENKQIVDVLREIEDNSNFRFFYIREQVDVERRVSVKARNATVEEILDELFAGEEVRYKVLEDNLVLLSPNNNIEALESLSQQQKSVSGTVTDEAGEPLPGVTVVVKGTTQGTVTNAEGEYQLTSIPEDATLQFSFVGMQTQEIPVENRTEIDVTLVVDAIGIEEVVAIGYGTQIRKNISSSISKVDVEKLNSVKTSSFEGALQGRASGVQVTSSGAMSGAPVKIRIRGSNSASAESEPLYVIDGVVMESGQISDTNPVGGFYMDFGTNVLASLNPNDIESLEILKDAAATAIYGARGANGVVLITTRTGKAGKSKIDINVETGISDATHRIKYLNAEEYLFLAHEAWYNSEKDPANFWDGSGVLVDGLTKEEALNTNTDWLDQVLRQGETLKADLSASGGNEKTRFYISAGILDEKSILEGNKFIRLTTRMNLEHNLTEHIKIGANMMFSYVHNEAVPIQNGVGKAIANLPIWPVYKEDGSFFNPLSNALASIELWDINLKSRNIIGSWYGSFNLAKGLVFRSEFGITSLSNEDHQYKDAALFSNNLARAYTVNGGRNSWNIKNMLNYNKAINNHRFDLLAGMEAQKFNRKSSIINGQGFSNVNQKTPQDAADITAKYDETEYSFLSYIGRLNYDYKGKYLLSVTARADGSSRFGENNRWGFFPAASVGYNISEETFFVTLKNTINAFKLRASYGLSGNAEIGNYAYYSTYEQANYNNNSGIVLSNIGDDELGWETTTQLNLGLSFELFKGKIRGEFDYYDKLTTDLLLPFPVSEITGVSSVQTNLGEISNKGYELMIGTTNIDKNGFVWESEFTFATNKNEVLSIGEDNTEGLDISGFGTTSIYTGYPIGIATVPIWVGIDPASGQNIYQDLEGNHLLENQAVNEYGTISNFFNANRVPYGNPWPKITGGIHNRFTWKGWYAQVFFTYEYGADYLTGELINTNYAFSAYNINPLNRILNRWRNPGDITDVARVTNAPARFGRTSEYFFDVDYLRMKDLTVGYQFKPGILSVESMNIYAKLTNYLTFTNAPDWVWDPENYRGGGNLNQTERWRSAPQSKMITLGVNVKF